MVLKTNGGGENDANHEVDSINRRSRLKPLIYLLVDFENVRPPAEDFARVRGEEYRLWIFHGPHQNKFDADKVMAWQPLGDQVRFVQSAKNGKNALDFHIAFCLGQAYQQDVVANRVAIYIVVSKDCGFESMFEYISSQGGTVKRASSIPKALTAAKKRKAKVANATNELSPQDKVKQPQITDEPKPQKIVKKSSDNATNQAQSLTKSSNNRGLLDKVIAFLKAHPKNLPTKLKALEHHLPSMIGGKTQEEAIKALMADLENEGIVKITGEKVEYTIPKAKKQDKKP